MANPTVIKLQDGNVMPQLGLGVWQASNEEVITAIQKALEVGYRSIDTAAAYKNEEGVGKALKNASVNREELFITTKLWNDDHKHPREALLDSLKKLQLDYIDLYLMHWPGSRYRPLCRSMERHDRIAKRGINQKHRRVQLPDPSPATPD